MIFRLLPHATARAGCAVYAAIEGGPLSPSAETPTAAGAQFLMFRDPGAGFRQPPTGAAEEHAWLDDLIAGSSVEPRLQADEVAELLGPDRMVLGDAMLGAWHVTRASMPDEATLEVLQLLSSKYHVPPHEIVRSWRFADMNFDANVAAPPRREQVGGLAIGVEP